MKVTKAAKIVCFGVLMLVAAAALFGQGQSQNNGLQQRVDVLEARNAALGIELRNLRTLFTHFTRIGDDIYITGANLHVLNGMGRTDTSNSLGNVIVGYNESRGRECPPLEEDISQCDIRSGSHMVVVGQGHNYTQYGGIVVGQQNAASGPFSNVSGGYGQTASGSWSSVSGGRSNTASGKFSIVSGGHTNVASGNFSIVSGGEGNVASALFSTISGSQGSTVNAFSHSSVFGGRSNVVSGGKATVIGGEKNEASGLFSSVFGGKNNKAIGEHSTVRGGLNNTAIVPFSHVP